MARWRGSPAACAALAVTLALAAPRLASAGDLRINEFMASNDRTLTNGLGDTSDWIEIYNDSGVATNLGGWHLTDNDGNLTKWQFPSTNIAAGAYLVVCCDSSYAAPVVNGRLYADFSLSASGEYLALVRPDGRSVEHAFAPKYPAQSADVSYGIGTSGELRFFTAPTPWAANNAGFHPVDPPVFSPERGFYSNAFSVAITSATAGASIRYTRDGATPSSANGTLYTGPISINSMTCLRAVAYKAGDYRPSPVVTHTYLFVGNVITQSLNNAAPGPGWPTSSVNGQVIDYEMDPSVCQGPPFSHLVDDALLAIPTISLVTDLGNLFDPTNGIYVNASVVLMERPTSAELIYPDGTVGFQENCGLRIRGGASAGPGNPKHAFRLRFRSEYGASTLKYKIFGEDGPDESNGVDLRCEQFPSFHASSPTLMNNARDIFSRDLQLACGQPSTRGDHYHLYLNGVYWGLYQSQENIEQPFLAENWGGNPEDWDVIAVKKYGGEVEGSDAAYRSLWTLTMNGFSGAAGLTNYFRAQGLNADGFSRNPAYTKLLDVDNLMDFMLGHYWTGEKDGMSGNWGLNNYVCAFNRAKPDGFKFFEYDSEWSLDVGFANNVGPYVMSTNFSAFCAQTIHQKLVENPEYLMAFADRTYLHMFNDGPMTPGNAIASVMTRVNALTNAIIAESARWGDSLVEPPMTQSNWLAAVRVTTNWMALRTPVVIGQLRAAGWYPGLDPPLFFLNGAAWNGGGVTNGLMLTMTAGNSISYTLDGTDPRALGGGNVGLTYSGPISLSNSCLVKARALSVAGGSNVWSALHEAVSTLDTPSPLRITEVMYHPRSPTGWETNSFASSDYEFIELKNTGNSAVGLAGLMLSDGVEFDFAQGAISSLASNEYVLVVANLQAFTNRHANWASMKIAGEWMGELDNGGERIRLVDRLGRTNSVFTYDDGRGWPQAADGAGHSLVPTIQDSRQAGVLDYGGNWRASAYVDGSPGGPDPAPSPTLLLNEIMAHTDYTNAARPEYDSNDWIEMRNASASPVSLTHWYLSDDAANLRKWAVPATNVVAPGGLLSFDEVTGFHSPITNGFGLDKAGERVFLSYLPGTAADRVADAVAFKGQSRTESWGRYPDGYAYWQGLPPTRGLPNASPPPGLMVTELMYHPPQTVTGEEEGWYEYVELYNAGAADLALWTGELGPWRIDGLGYSFPSNTTIWSGEVVLLVGFDPQTNAAALSAFTARYGALGGTRLFGPYNGRLANGGERLAAEWGQAGDLQAQLPSWIVEDEVLYFDQPPFPTNAGGAGSALARALGTEPGADPAVWSAGEPTPGLPPAAMSVTAPHQGAVGFAPFAVTMEVFVDMNQVRGSVRRVEFYEGANLLGVDAAAPYTQDWRQPVPGTYLLGARLVDDGGVYTARSARVFVNELDNDAGAVRIADRATLRGNLDGPASARMRVYWGKHDGGTNLQAWDHVEDLGERAPGAFTASAEPLDPDTTYYYRCYAWSPDDATWAPAASSFSMPEYGRWLSRRLRVTFEGYDGAEALVGFPALVRLGSSLEGFSYADCAPGGSDLRFVDQSGRLAIPCEIERWDTNGESAVWVRIPRLSGTNTWVWMHWGDPAAQAPAYARDGSVWSSGFRGVWHLEDGGHESTAFANHGAAHGSVTRAEGVAGGSCQFSSAGGYLGPVLDAGWLAANLTNLTVSLWARPGAAGVAATVFGAHGTTSNPRTQVWLDITQQSGPWAFRVKDRSSATHGADVGAWQYLALVMKPADWVAYKNAAAAAAQPNASFSPTNAAAIGALYDAAAVTNWFLGSIDEVRVSSVPRSADWLRAEWLNMASNATFNRYGPVWVDSDLDGLSDRWELTYFPSLSASDGTADGDLDGLSDLDEQVGGTHPGTDEDRLSIGIENAVDGVRVWFDTFPTVQPDYGGLRRYYDLEFATNLRTAWQSVGGYLDLPGMGAPVAYTNTAASNAFYRVRARLR